MKTILAVLFAMALVMPAFAGTLYDQEGTASDGYAGINAAGQGPVTNPNSSNWKYQYGGTSTWSGVYDWGAGWVEETTTGGNGALDIEADIEMYCATSVTDPKLYFHLGNIYNLASADKEAHVLGTMTSNNGQYIGLSFDGQSKTAADFDLGTGIISDAMVGTIDAGNRPLTAAFDIRIMMSWGAGYRLPDAYGDGAHSTIHDTLWWLVNAGTPGSYNVDWRINLLPEANQPDGNYHLDPVVTAAPVL